MNKSNILSKIRELFASEQFAADYPTIDGQTIRCLGDALREGEKVVKIVAGEEKPVEDGNYVLENGKSITVKAGQIESIAGITESNMEKQIPTKDEEQTIVEKMADYKNEIASKLMDGTDVKIMSKGDALSVGDLVLVKDAEGNFVKAPEGRHILEGGLTIYVDAEGFINELETEETDKTTESDEMKSMFEALEQLTSVVSSLKEKFESISKTNSELNERFEKFAAEPSSKSITYTEKKVERFNSKADKAKYFGQI
jgi:hypothetical protein